MHYPEPIAQLMDSYMKLPGIGEKTAARLAFYTVNMNEDDVTRFAKSLISVKRDLQYCSVCGNMTQNDPCDICQDKNRDQSIILVVESPTDVIAMEKMQDFKGLYHDVSTLAHELGHSMHSYYSVKNNSYPNYRYKIFVAEVA